MNFYAIAHDFFGLKQQVYNTAVETLIFNKTNSGGPSNRIILQYKGIFLDSAGFYEHFIAFEFLILWVYRYD